MQFLTNSLLYFFFFFFEKCFIILRSCLRFGIINFFFRVKKKKKKKMISFVTCVVLITFSTHTSITLRDNTFKDFIVGYESGIYGGGNDSVHVVLEGTHYITHSIHVRSWTPELSISGGSLQGGVKIPFDYFKKDEHTLGRYNADITSFSIDLKQINNQRDESCNNMKAEAYFNDKRMFLAGYPKISKLGELDIIDWNYVLEANNSEGVFWYSETLDSEAVKWSKNINSIWMHGYWFQDWADNYVKPIEINLEHRWIRVNTSATPFEYGVQKNGRWRVINSELNLDTPNEYFISTTDANQILSILPNRKSKDLLRSDDVIISKAEIGIDVEYQKCSLSNMHVGFFQSTAIKSVNGTLTVHNCTLIGAGNMLINSEGYNTLITDNTISETGCSGIQVFGGDVFTLQSSNAIVSRNRIHQFSKWKRTYNPGISFNGVGHVFSSNHIGSSPHAGALGLAIKTHWENNVFYNLTYECTDSGAWYAGRTWVARSNSFVGNLFVDIFTRVPVSLGYICSMGLYHDDMFGDSYIVNNTFKNCHSACFLGGSRHTIVEGNEFINCNTSVHLDARGLTSGKDCDPPNGVFWKQLDVMNYTNPPWSVEFPELINAPHPCLPWHTNITGNSYCGPSFVNFTDFTEQNATDWGVQLLKNKYTGLC